MADIFELQLDDTDAPQVFDLQLDDTDAPQVFDLQLDDTDAPQVFDLQLDDTDAPAEVEVSSEDELSTFGRIANTGGSYVEGVARKTVELFSPSSAETEALDIGDEGAGFEAEVASGLGEATVETVGFLGSVALGAKAGGTAGALIGSPTGPGAGVTGLAGAGIGAVIGGGGFLLWSGVQGIRRTLFGVEEETKKAYKAKTGQDAPQEVIDTARSRAFTGAVTGEVADGIITAVTAGTGKIITTGAKSIFKSGGTTVAKEVQEEIIKREAAKQALTRVGKLKRGLSTTAKAATGEFAAENIQQSTERAAVETAVSGEDFGEFAAQSAQNVTSPESIRAGLVGAVVAGTAVGGSQAADVEGRVERYVQQINDNAKNINSELQAEVAPVSETKLLEDGLDVLEERTLQEDLGGQLDPTTETALSINERIALIENDDVPGTAVEFDGGEVSTATLKEAYGDSPNLIIEGREDGSTRVVHVPEAERGYEKVLREKSERLQEVRAELDDIDSTIQKRNKKIARLERRVERKRREVQRFEQATERTQDLDQDEAAETNFEKFERAQDQLEQLESRLERIKGADEKQTTGSLKAQRDLLLTERDALQEATGQFAQLASEEREAALDRAEQLDQGNISVTPEPMEQQVAENRPVLTPAEQQVNDSTQVLEKRNTFAVPVATRAKQFKAFLTRELTPTRGVGEAVFDAQLEANAQVDADIKRAQVNIANLDNALAKEGLTKDSPETNALMTQFLSGTREEKRAAREQLPSPVLKELERMRRQTDILSDSLIQSGAVQGEMAAIVDANKGTYLTRSYRIFEDPNWVESVQQNKPVMNRAIGLFRKQIPRRANESWDAYQDRVDNKLRQFLYEFTNGDNLFDVVAKAVNQTGVNKKLGILKQRKEIPVEIRELLGEKTSAPENYIDSVSNISRLINTHKFLSTVKTVGLRNGFLSKPSNPNPEHVVEIAAQGSNTLTPLNGLLTTPEYRDAFQNAFKSENLSGTWRVISAASAYTKVAATVGSLKTHARNFIGNVGLLIGNGHWNLLSPTNWEAATVAFRGEFSNNLETQKRFDKYTRLGLTAGVRVEDIRGVVADFSKASSLEQYATRRFGKLAGAITGVAEKAYKAEDTFWKIYAFEAELSRLKNTYPERTQADLEQQAAKTIQQTMPNYELVPKGIQKLRRVPVIAPFVSFHAEVARNIYNINKIALAEIKDPRTRATGFKRIAGTALAVSMYDIVLSEAINTFSGAEEEELEAMRVVAAPWDQNGDLAVTSKEDGNYTYANFSTINPFGVFKNTLNVMTDRPDLRFDQVLGQSLITLFGPFLSEDLLASKIADISRNTQQGTGKPVYNPDSLGLEMAVDIAAHLAQAFKPGIIDQLRDVNSTIWGGVDLKGRPSNIRSTVASNLLGFRQTTLVPEQQAFFKAKDYTDSLVRGRNEFNRVAKRAQVSDAELKDSIDRLSGIYGTIQEKAAILVNALRTLRMTDDQIEQKFKDARMPEEMREALLADEPIQFEIPKATLDELFEIEGRVEQIERVTGKPIDDVFRPTTEN